MSDSKEIGKPTPGPWLYRGKSSSVHESCATHPSGKVIFKFHEGYEGDELPEETDLDLILAAPDLLEAAELGSVALAKFICPYDIEYRALMQMLAAIDKAKGIPQ